jgi:hypothetical protein
VSECTLDDDEIRTLVTRLARPQPSGGATIERAALLAAGADFPQVIEWITRHAGVPESAVSSRKGSGLHGPRLTEASESARPPVRYVLPPGALD